MTLVLRQQHADRAFEHLYRAHVGDVYRYALAITGNPSDAEDVTQTAFMNAYRAIERGERPVKPHNWLIAITHNICRQRFRQAARRPSEVAFDEDLAESLVPADEAPTAADIQRALGHLPLNQREALVLRELEGRSYAEIAEVLAISVSAVETLLFRARRALREQLEGSLTCQEAEEAISRQLDGRLSRAERGALRAHLRECSECARLARRQRAQRRGWKALAAVPLPPSLGSLFGGGGAGIGVGIGAGVAAKVAAVTVAAAVVGGGGYAIARHETSGPQHKVTAQSEVTARTGRVGQRAKPALHRTGSQPRRVPPAAAAGAPPAAAVASAGGTASTPAAAAGQTSNSKAPSQPLHPVRPSAPAHPVKPSTPSRGQGRAHAGSHVVGRSTLPSSAAACKTKTAPGLTQTVPGVARAVRCPKPLRPGVGNEPSGKP